MKVDKYSNKELEILRNQFTAYIVKVIKHSAIDFKRKDDRYNKIIESIENKEALLSVGDSDAFSFCFENYEYDKLENLFKNPRYAKAMKPLTDRQKLILHLSIVEEWNQKEIAEFIGITTDSVKSTKSQAIQKFLRNLEEQK